MVRSCFKEGRNRLYRVVKEIYVERMMGSKKPKEVWNIIENDMSRCK